MLHEAVPSKVIVIRRGLIGVSRSTASKWYVEIKQHCFYYRAQVISYYIIIQH